MNVNYKKMDGVWDLGYSLDKHIISSTPDGHNEWGYPKYKTIRTEAGEALFQLKYRSDYSQVALIANQMNHSFSTCFVSADYIIPMPSSTPRKIQPVTEIARELSKLMNKPCVENLLQKTVATASMKDITAKAEKMTALEGKFTVYDVFGEGQFDILMIDDLFDTGATLETATNVLRAYPKIRNIYIATVTRKRQ